MSELKKFCAFSRKFVNWRIWVEEIARRKRNADNSPDGLEDDDGVFPECDYRGYAESVMNCFRTYYNEKGRKHFDFDDYAQKNELVERLIEVAEKMYGKK